MNVGIILIHTPQRSFPPNSLDGDIDVPPEPFGSVRSGVPHSRTAVPSAGRLNEGRSSDGDSRGSPTSTGSEA